VGETFDEMPVPLAGDASRGRHMLTGILVSFPVVFLAELPDKSQLITMSYALRYRAWLVLSGAALAAFMVHGLSVTIGHFLGLTLPQRPLAFVAATVFLAFAIWAWRGSGDSSVTTAGAAPGFVLPAIISSYLLAELGDMTMFASIALAANHNWLGVWIGATAAMVTANGLAIAMARLLHKRLPIGLLHRLAGLLFVLLGLWLLFDAALGWPLVAVTVTTAAAAAALLVSAISAVRRRRASV
jgi:Ca2+/H+ antiporter, TMEM165/GDT1 family